MINKSLNVGQQKNVYGYSYYGECIEVTESWLEFDTRVWRSRAGVGGGGGGTTIQI